MVKLWKPLWAVVATGGLFFGGAITALVMASLPAASQEQPISQNLFAKPPFLNWIDSEGIPVHRGFVVDDLTKVKLGPWKRYGTLGAVVNLDGAEGVTTGMLWGVEPGQKSIPVHHVFEGRVIVLAGNGETRFWQDGGKQVTAIWQKGTLFPLPMNTWYQFVNTGREPARLFAVTNAPVIMDLFRDMTFIFDDKHKFADRFDGAADYFKPEPIEFKVSLKDRLGYAVSRTNLVPDVLAAKLYPAGHGSLETAWRKAGGSGTMNHHYSMAFDALDSHVEQFQPAVYEVAHRHVGGAYVMYLSGEGYTLLWPKEAGTRPYASGHGDQVIRVPWHANTLFVPPTDWFHQHFNPSGEPAKFIKVAGFLSRIYMLTARELFEEHSTVITFENEDPKIKEIFEEEVKKNGRRSNMPSVEEILKKANEPKPKH